MWRNFYVYAFVILFFIQFISLATSISTEKDASFSQRSKSKAVLPLHGDADYDHESPVHNDEYSSKEVDGEDEDYEDEYGDENEGDAESDPKHFGLPLKEGNDGAGDNDEDDESDDDGARLLYDYNRKLPKLNGNSGTGKIDSITTTPPTSTTSKITAAPSSDVSMSCPKGCACLGDFMDCIRQHLNVVPSVPDWVHSL